jgi:hypothetical protein
VDNAPGEALLRRLPFFDVAEYLLVNEDVARDGMDPLRHYWNWGRHEGRPIMSPAGSARIMSQYRECGDALARFPYIDQDVALPTSFLGQRVALLTASGGNFYMDEIAEHVQHGLHALGVPTIRGNEHTQKALSAEHVVIVAPHEFFTLADAPKLAERAVMMNTEQLQTVYFARALPHILASGRVIDINYQLACMFQDAGIETLYYMPGYAPDLPNCPPASALPDHPLTEALPNAVRNYDLSRDIFAERPIDVTFMGNQSLIRNEFLARNAAFFAARQCHIVYRQRQIPMIPGTFTEALPRVNAALGRRSKVVLNIHRDGVGYFEWARIVLQGIWQKAVVVTNPCVPHPFFRPGEHFFEESLDRIPKLIGWIIDTPEGQALAERVRSAAFDVLVRQCALRRFSLALAEFLARTGEQRKGG